MPAQQPPPPPAPLAEPMPGGGIEPQATNTVAFPREFFAEFRPTSALDMINRVPGFTFNRGNGDVRGLAGSGGNVLIDGQRPVTKSLGLDEIIRRLPVRVVLRIDLIRGGAPGVDMAGQTVVANIIRDPRGFSSLTGEFQTKLYGDHWPARNPRIEGSWVRGAWSLSGSVSRRDEKDQGGSGVGQITRRDLSGASGTSAGRFEADGNNNDTRANASIEYRAGADLVRLNSSAGQSNEKRRDRTDISDPAGRETRELVASDARTREGELSLDYEHALPGGLTARAMLLQRFEQERNVASSFGRGVPQDSRNTELEGESIGRLAATYVPLSALTIDASAEGSFNFLNSQSALRRAGVPVILPTADVRVRERRGNFAVSARWQGTPWLTIEGGSGYELSTIRQTGDSSQSKSLNYWKPRVVATIDPAANWQLRLRGERTVGQLDFGDFATNVSLEPGAVNAGNPNLVPETSVLGEVALEHRFWGRGAVTLTASHAAISDAIDLVPIGGLFDAPGNIGDGWREEIKLASTVPTDNLGVRGGQVRLTTTWRRSRVTDPVTGQARRISRQRPFSLELNLTKDLPRLRSQIGMDFYSGYREVSYRLFELRTERSTIENNTRLYWDWTPSARTAIRFQFENWTFRRRSRTRVFYAGSRALGRIVSVEDRDTVLEPLIMMRFRRQF